MIPETQLAHWEQVCREATPEPWDLELDGREAHGSPTYNLLGPSPFVEPDAPRGYILGGGPLTECGHHDHAPIIGTANAAFIAAARTALPALLEEVRRLKAEAKEAYRKGGEAWMRRYHSKQGHTTTISAQSKEDAERMAGLLREDKRISIVNVCYGGINSDDPEIASMEWSVEYKCWYKDDEREDDE